MENIDLTTPMTDDLKTAYPFLDEFVMKMRKELDSNAYKGDWREWQPTRESAMDDLEHHVAKLRAAIFRNGFWHPGQEYAADVANIALKIYEILTPKNPVTGDLSTQEQL